MAWAEEVRLSARTAVVSESEHGYLDGDKLTLWTLNQMVGKDLPPNTRVDWRADVPSTVAVGPVGEIAVKRDTGPADGKAQKTPCIDR